MHEAIGRTHTLTDVMDPARAVALHAVLGIAGPPPEPGDSLPPFWHQVYFWTIAPGASLGADGHPALGGFVPDLGLPDRMWAGGELTFLNPLLTGIEATRTSTIENIELKSGRSGTLAFVTLRQEITQGGTPDRDRPAGSGLSPGQKAQRRSAAHRPDRRRCRDFGPLPRDHAHALLRADLQRAPHSL